MITHLWELGYFSGDKAAPLEYGIEIMGVDRDVSFRESFKGIDVNEVKMKAMDFIIKHHKLKSKTFNNGDLLTVGIGRVTKKFIIDQVNTDAGSPIINGTSIDGADKLSIEHAKKVNTP